jgi:hypothetical protein
MRAVEVHRHSLPALSGERLSAEGRYLAQCLGDRVGGFTRAITSPSPLALETAIEMGCGAPEVRPGWDRIGGDALIEIDWPAPFARYVPLLRANTACSRRARGLLVDLEGVLSALPEAGRGLIVTHAGVPELVTAALFPHSEVVMSEGPLRYMEGVRLVHGNGGFLSAEILRVPLRLTRL